MAFTRDPLDELVVPDGTEAQERDLVTDGDVLVGGRATVEFGVRGRNVLAGEGARFGGGIEADGDCRLDMWAEVADSVLVGQDAYLGERVNVGGELKVAGDLDIGDDVDIEDGFEANGWIVIRNPMPTIVFLFVYLKHLLVLGEEDAAQQLIDEMVDADGEAPTSEPLVVPASGTVSDDAWRVSTPGRIGDDCRLHGNIRAESLSVGAETEIFGSLRARGDVSIGAKSVIHGDVTTRDGSISLGQGTRVLGDLSCQDLELGATATVEGTMRASGEITMATDPADDEPPLDRPSGASTPDAGADESSPEADGDDSSPAAESDDGNGDATNEPDTSDDEGDESLIAEDDDPNPEMLSEGSSDDAADGASSPADGRVGLDHDGESDDSPPEIRADAVPSKDD